MKHSIPWMAVLLGCCSLSEVVFADVTGTVGTEITYQGELSETGIPADGTYDFQFLLFDNVGGGTQLGPTVSIGDQPVLDGIFTVPLDFGSVYETANAAWLEIRVREGSSGGAYTTLSPRQPLNAAPYALTATSVLPNSIGSDEILSSEVQARVTGTCTPPLFATGIAQGGSMNCGSSLSSGYWQAGAGSDIHYSAGDVGINTTDPEFDFQVNGEFFVNTSSGRLNLGFPSNGNQWRFSTQGSGANLQFQSKPSGSFTYTRRMYLQGSTGNVAIGNNGNPDEELVVGTNLGSGWALPAVTVGGTTGGLFEAGNADYKIAMENSSTLGRARIIVTSPTGFGRGETEMRTNGLTIGENAGSPLSYMLKVEHGSFGINIARAGTTNDWEFLTSSAAASNLNLYANGAFRGNFSGTDGTWNPSSDRKFKTNIEPLEPILDRFLQLSPSRYQIIEQNPENKVSIGFIAQEVQPLFPELVSNIDDGRTTALTLNYSGFGVLAVKAIQEQKAVIDALEGEVEDLKSRLEALERALGQ